MKRKYAQSQLVQDIEAGKAPPISRKMDVDKASLFRDGDDEVLQQSVQRPRIDHQGHPAQRDSLARRLAQGTRPNRASRHLPGNSFESFKKLKYGKTAKME